MVAPYGDSSFAEHLLANRIVMLGQEVNDEIANKLCAQLLYLEGESREADIWMYINSPGGSVTAGMAIYDTMQFVGCDVATVAMGFAASMGQFLLCAGAPGKRFILPNARVLMHQPSAGLQGVATDIAIQAAAFGHTKSVLAERTAAHTGQSVEQIRIDWDRDRWFNADEALAYGFIDRILTNRRDLAMQPSTTSQGNALLRHSSLNDERMTNT
jgi:ATP-dependent Clp protease, protease subunit